MNRGSTDVKTGRLGLFSIPSLASFEMSQQGQEVWMNLQEVTAAPGNRSVFDPAVAGASTERNWYAVYTAPQHEKSALKQLCVRDIETFLPTYETVRGWKNRQRIKLTIPLFPTYLFVRINLRERTRVLQSPGVLRIVGNRKESVPLRDCEVDFLRSGSCSNRIEPYRELVVGERVRIKSGVMQGLE